MSSKDTPKSSKKESKSRSKRSKKTADVLHEKVRATVGRGVDAFFASEVGVASTAATTDNATNTHAVPTAEEAEDALEALLASEARAAGDAREEISAKPTTPPRARENTSDTEEEPPPPRESAARTTSTEEEPSVEEIASSLPEEPEPPRPTTTPPATADTTPDAEETAKPTAMDVTPPRLRPAGTLLEHPTTVKVTPPGPGGDVRSGIPQPERTSATLSREEILMRISKEHFDRLEEEINLLYNEVPRVLGSNKKLTDQALTALRSARELLWTAPERLVDAEYQVNQVKAILERHRLSGEWGRVYGRRLLIYEVTWLVLFLGGFLAVQLGQDSIMRWLRGITGAEADATYIGVIIPFVTSLMWGGIGGVVGALYSLWWHVSEVQDFDKRYNMWYLVQPVMGFVLGGIVYLIIGTGFLALQGTAPTVESARGVQMFPALVAVLGGFRQKFVYELLERIIRVLTPSTPKEEKGEASEMGAQG